MSETATAQLTGVQKAALVIMQLTPDHAASIMRELTEAEAEEIAGEIVRLKRVDTVLVDGAISEFHDRTLTTSSSHARGGREFAEELLQASFGAERAAGLIERIASTTAGASFEFLDSADTHQVSSLLIGELPETIALVLAHLKPHTASEVLGHFEPALRVDIAQAIASMRIPTPEAASIVADTLKHAVRAVVPANEKAEIRGGVQPLVEIINRADVATEHELLEALDERNPALAEEVRSRLITFADLTRLDGKGAQQVLRGIDAVLLATALKGATAELVAMVRENISERNRETLDEEIQNLGPVRKKQIDEARAEIAHTIRELESQGVVALNRGDEAEEEDFVD